MLPSFCSEWAIPWHVVSIFHGQWCIQEKREGLTASAGGELHIPALHPIKVLSLRALRALFDHAVPVCEFPAQDVAEDLGVAVRVCREAIARRDTVLVQDAQTAKVHEAVVEVAGETKRVERLEPAAMLGVASFAGAARDDLGVGESSGHVGWLLLIICDRIRCLVYVESVGESILDLKMGFVVHCSSRLLI